MSRPASPSGRPTPPPGAARANGRREGRAGRPGPRRGGPVQQDAARTAAWQTLRAVREDDAYANLVLPGLLRRAGLHGRDAALATELAYGTLRGLGTYDAVIAACADRPLTEVDPGLLDAVRLGAHQLLATRVPTHAAVSTSVDLVRAHVGQGAARFANAVLRRVAERDLDGWLTAIAPDATADPDGHLAVTRSHPAWVVRALRSALSVAGRDPAELPDLLDADNARPLVALAALPGLATVTELLPAPPTGDRVPDGPVPDGPVPDGRAPGRTVSTSPGGVSPLAVVVDGGPPESLPAVAEGRARVQDEGSQLVALALATAPVVGQDQGRWLDLCAGPGGKAALLAALLARGVPGPGVPGPEGPEAGRSGSGDPAGLVAVEVSAHRAELVRRALAAVPGSPQVRQADGRETGEQEPGQYDRVLVDAPCTGLGALRRRPEARWRRTPADLATLAPLQRALLTSALAAVRPGGVVAYVTCSPHPAETGLVVDDVLRRRDDVERLDACAIAVAASDGRLSAAGPGPDLQLWPHVHGTDAMFLALLRRT